MDAELESTLLVPGGTNVQENVTTLNLKLDKTPTVPSTAHNDAFDDESSSACEEMLLNELSRRDITVFVLSDAGKPIFVSCGHEEQLCALVALVHTFVMMVTAWNDSLVHIRCAQLQISLLYRSPLVLCIASRSSFQLDVQIEMVYKQILSIICRAQLVSIFQSKGPNFDLRIMLKGSERHLNAISCLFMNDAAFFMRSLRIFPMPVSERESISNAICTSNVIYGIMLFHRQLVTSVRLKGIALHPYDVHLIINLIECNPSLKYADNWIPICLPNFNDAGFLYAFVSFVWESCDLCLILLSLERNAFEVLREVKDQIVNKLYLSKISSYFKSAIIDSGAFLIEKTQLPDVWHFIYKNRCSNQMCSAKCNLPFVNENDLHKLLSYYKKLYGISIQTSNIKLFASRVDCSLLSNVTVNYELHCIMSPFVSRANANVQADRLLKILKKDESRYFFSSVNF